MIEEFSLKLFELSEAKIYIIYFILMVIGGLLSHFSCKNLTKINRTPYYLSIAFIYFLGSLFGEFPFIFSQLAIEKGFFSLILLCSLTSTICMGYCLYKYSLQRSLDAYGVKNYAFLAFIPIANLGLIFTSSKKIEGINEEVTYPFYRRAPLGIVLGVILLILAKLISKSTEHIMERIDTTDSFIKAKGINDAIETLVKVPNLPIQIDEHTTLKKLTANKNMLIREYDVAIKKMDVLRLRSLVMNAVCSSKELSSILDNGGVIKEYYKSTIGTQEVSVYIDKKICGINFNNPLKVEDRLSIETSQMKYGLPMKIDNLTVLTDIKNNGKNLVYEYVVDVNLAGKEALQAGMQEKAKESLCFGGSTYSLINAGVTYIYSYKIKDGTPLMSIIINKDSCTAK